MLHPPPSQTSDLKYPIAFRQKKYTVLTIYFQFIKPIYYLNRIKNSITYPKLTLYDVTKVRDHTPDVVTMGRKMGPLKLTVQDIWEIQP